MVQVAIAVSAAVHRGIAIVEGTVPTAETVVEYFPIVVVGADMEAVDTVAAVADSTLEVVVDTVAQEEAVVVVETSYEFLSTKKYTVAYYTLCR